MRATLLVLLALVACDRPSTSTKSVATTATTATSASSAPSPPPPPPAVDAAAPANATIGDTTLLTVTGPGRPMRLDGPAPGKTWTLLSKADPSKVIATGKLDGDYRPVAYARDTHAFVMLYFGQTGAWYGIRDIALLDEQGKLRENLVTREFFAVTDAESKDGQFIALVGKINDAHGATNFRLLVFDVASAQVREVGPAPQAPPGEPESCEGTGGQSWIEPSGIAGYQPIDEGILSFEDGALLVSRGADSCKGRAKKRDVIRYPLRVPTGAKSSPKSGGVPF